MKNTVIYNNLIGGNFKNQFKFQTYKIIYFILNI